MEPIFALVTVVRADIVALWALASDEVSTKQSSFNQTAEMVGAHQITYGQYCLTTAKQQ